MHEDETIFGVNFIDGRIKGYGTTLPNGEVKTFYVLVVRGNKNYGENDFIEGDNKTVIDQATGLIWQKNDSVKAMNFKDSLGYCEALSLAGNNNWRLPNIKALQSIVDYFRSPNTSNSAAISPIFNMTPIVNEAGIKYYANYWSSTTHVNLKNAANATYISFGRSTGYMQGQWLDVHGAGSQRSDPKSGDASQYPQGKGPQGDAIRIYIMVRCVSGCEIAFISSPKNLPRQAMIIDNFSPTSISQLPKDFYPLTMMDKNGDGKISLSEAKGPLRKDFKKLDGYLIATELPKKRH